MASLNEFVSGYQHRLVKTITAERKSFSNRKSSQSLPRINLRTFNIRLLYPMEVMQFEKTLTDLESDPQKATSVPTFRPPILVTNLFSDMANLEVDVIVLSKKLLNFLDIATRPIFLTRAITN